jgi:hypothetical protein
MPFNFYKITQIQKWLGQHKISTQSQWSTCELSLTEIDYQTLLDTLKKNLDSEDFRKISHFRQQQPLFPYKPTSDYDWLGLVLTITISECARRESSEGRFWTPIARKFLDAHWHGCMFTFAGQPTQMCRELLENAARHFNLRHVYGRDGGMNWYVSLLLQIGFTQRGFAMRLPEWLAGAPVPLAIGYLLGTEGEGSLHCPAFSSLWDNLWQYRRNKHSEKQVRNALKSNTLSAWILPEWVDELVCLARERRHLDKHYIATTGVGATNDDEENEHGDEFLAQPHFIWNHPDAPIFKSEFVNLNILKELSEPDYALLIAKREITRLIRQPNGAYSPLQRDITLPSLAPAQLAEIVAPSGISIYSQTLKLYTPDEELSIFDLKTGCIITNPDEAALDGSHGHAIILTEDLRTIPQSDADHTLKSINKKMLYFQPLGEAQIQISLDEEVLWNIGSANRPQHSIDIDGIQLRWENAFARIDGNDGIISLELPKACILRHLRKDGKNIAFSQKNGRHMADFGQLDTACVDGQTSTWKIGPFQITPNDHLNSVSMDLHIRYKGCSFHIRRRIVTIDSGVWWQHDGKTRMFSDQKPLYAAHAERDSFLVKLNLPPGIINDSNKIKEFYKKHALIEGGFFHRRLNGMAKPFGRLHGFGQPLVVRDDIYNQTKDLVKIVDSVIDTGLLTALRIPDDDLPYLELYQPLYPQDEHRIIIVKSDLSIRSFPCAALTEKKNFALALSLDALEGDYLAIGIFFQGCRLGSIWNHTQYGIFKTPPPVDVKKIIHIIRLFKYPILSSRCRDATRQLLHQHITAFVETWMTENDDVEIDGITFKSPGLDEGSAYAFSELMGLDTLFIDGETAEELIGRYDDAPCGKFTDSAAFRSQKILKALDTTLRELSRLSPWLAASVIRVWIEDFKSEFPDGTTATSLTDTLCNNLLGGMTETQLLEQISQLTKTDDHFIRALLQNRQIPHWKNNVRRLLHIGQFRALFTRAFLKGVLK